MDVLIERCAGLDVHRDTVVATVRRPGPGGARRSETRTFTTMTGQLEALADWLTAQEVTLVGMESTVYVPRTLTRPLTSAIAVSGPISHSPSSGPQHDLPSWPSDSPT